MLLNALWAGTPVTEADKELTDHQTQPVFQHFETLLTVGVMHEEFWTSHR